MKAWDKLTDNEKALACRMQEAFAAFLDHTDKQIGRLVEGLRRLGQLDNTVAGGQPVGLGVFENLVKECGEEASIPPELARQAKAVSFVSYWNQSGPQLKPDLMTCFDLELPESFTPRANDGEVHAFELWPVRRVFETVRDTVEFKYNCNLVLIDFFVRHGLLAADDPDFIRIVEGLRNSRRH